MAQNPPVQARPMEFLPTRPQPAVAGATGPTWSGPPLPPLDTSKPGRIGISTHEFVQFLTQIEHGRQSEIDKRWALIPFYIDEIGADSTGTATSISLTAATRNLFLVEEVIASVPTGSTGTLQLGNRKLPIPAGVTHLTVRLALQPSDTRSLTIAPAGSLALWVMGMQEPVFGKVR